MVSMIVGLVFFAFTVIACLPGCLNWGADVIMFLKGFLPVFSAFIGLVAVFIGIADIRDRREAKKEEEAALAQESK
ncbi:MAG: hypothetical protein MJ178_04805 [Treponemataceae bacterium]|nr:hypothetical protein [Treponemataceae bacterium]